MVDRKSKCEMTFRNRTIWLKTATFCVIIVTLLCSPLSGALQEERPDSWPRTIQDDQQQSVMVPSVPSRIVSLAPSNTEVLFALGLDERIVGVTDYCNYPAEALDKSRIGGFSTVSIEKVVALHPDLVIASPGNNLEAVDRIKGLGIPVYYADAQNLDGICATFEKLGYITGTSDKASEIIADLKAREEKVRKEGEAYIKNPVIAHVIWYDPIYVSGKGTFQDELIQIAGGVNAFSDKSSHAIVNIEEFISKKPDIIMVNSGSGMGSDKTDIMEYFMNEPRLSGLSAIASNKTIMVDSDIADRAGPRLWDLLEEIAPKIREL